MPSVAGIKRPTEGANEGKTPELSDAQARYLLAAPMKGKDPGSIKARWDRAILATYLFHALRRSEVTDLRVLDMRERRGVMHFAVFGKSSKTRYVPVHPAALSAIQECLAAEGIAMTDRAPFSAPSATTARAGWTWPLPATGSTSSTEPRPGPPCTG